MQDSPTSPRDMSPDPEPVIWTEALFREALEEGNVSEILKGRDSRGVTGFQFAVLYIAQGVERLQPLVRLLEPSPKEASQLPVIVNFLRAIGSTQEMILEGQRKAEADRKILMQRMERLEQRLFRSRQG